MSILKSADGNEMIVTCSCGCDEGIHFVFDKEAADLYCCMTFLNGRFYQEQENRLLKKVKRIWAILRNRDYCYAEICMTEKQFLDLKAYIDSF